MPCNSDYMAADGREIALSRVACLLDELDGQPKINKSHWAGYHPRVYSHGLSKAAEDKLVAELCRKLQGVDVTKCSLEMQLWWRDHHEADRIRVAAELQNAKDEESKKAALEKLTPHERRLLGLK